MPCKAVATTQVILLYRALLFSQLSNNPGYSNWLNAIGLALWDRYKRTKQMNDMDHAISYFRQASLSYPHPCDAGTLSNLGNILMANARAFKDTSESDEAISYYRRALDSVSALFEHRSALLCNLGDALSYCYDRRCLIADLNEAIRSYERALDLPSPHHRDRVTQLLVLSRRLQLKYSSTQDMEDMENAIKSCSLGISTLVEELSKDIQYWWEIAHQGAEYKAFQPVCIVNRQAREEVLIFRSSLTLHTRHRTQDRQERRCRGMIEEALCRLSPFRYLPLPANSSLVSLPTSFAAFVDSIVPESHPLELALFRELRDVSLLHWHVRMGSTISIAGNLFELPESVECPPNPPEYRDRCQIPIVSNAWVDITKGIGRSCSETTSDDDDPELTSVLCLSAERQRFEVLCQYVLAFQDLRIADVTRNCVSSPGPLQDPPSAEDRVIEEEQNAAFEAEQ
ncbi:hypothetical protein NMY22_g14429 [Coprinellus aureogranulatus]|nr:hypothetical protein NMY22_g14429 [Coprinellus aureogranulatus]